MSTGFHAYDADGGLSWQPPPLPQATSVDFAADALAPWAPEVTAQWNHQLANAPLPETHSIRFDTARPRAISIPIQSSDIRVQSFVFDVPVQLKPINAGPQEPGVAGGPSLSSATATGATATGATRIKPPSDIIKLGDRLEYLLQPPLQTLLSERSMTFPFHPFPYQFEGVAFLYPRHAAVLADEMGLGKTMQAITTIRLLLRCGEVRSVLLICPKPLVTNWRREFNVWAPEIPVTIVEGDQAKRRWQWQLPDVPVRIANYELVCRDRELFDRPLRLVGGDDQEECQQQESQEQGPLRFDLVVLDEAQRIKNRLSTTSQIVRSISRSRNWALTGTPVENSPEDLVGIFEFLSPGFLSSDMKPRRMGRTVSDYVLRRTKDLVLTDLPPKLFRDAEMELSPEQRESYRLAEDDGVVRLTEMGDAATIQHVFELVLRLKQICNFDPATGTSAKLERLEADLEEIARSGRKAIVFSQWVCSLKRLAKTLGRFGPLEYHGQIPSKRRDDVIARFRDDPNSHVLLMSYGAGSVGLNLQFTNYVFLFDRWWNPAVEDQAINRAHRIGVDGPVTVTRFLMLETIEERINLILEEKRELFDTIFSEGHNPRKMGLTQDEIFGLFQLKTPKGPIDAAA